MLVPRHFAVRDRTEMLGFIDRYPFGLLISASPSAALDASHIAFRRTQDKARPLVLQAHVARANPQWRALRTNPSALVVFAGPHAYVSPLWGGDALTVPTWNYVAVHARGRARVVEDAELLRIQLAGQVRQFEGADSQSWNLERLGDRLNHFLSAIVGIEIEVTGLTGQYKLSQNKPQEQRRSIVAALDRSGQALDREVAQLMREADAL